MKQFINSYIISIIASLSVIGATTNIPTGPVSLTCDVVIDGVYLDDSSSNIGDTIIIETSNTNTKTTFSYPGFKVYVVDNNGNTLFGKAAISDNTNPQTFTITSNTIKFQPNEEINLSLELWSGSYDIWECTFTLNERINFKKPIPSTCDVVIDAVYLDDKTANIGDTITIVAHNTNFATNIFIYPGFKVYIVDSNGNNILLFGAEEVRSYGIGDSPQYSSVVSTTTRFQTGQDIILSIELWSGLYTVLECIFNWNGKINFQGVTSPPIETTTTTTTTSTTSTSDSSSMSAPNDADTTTASSTSASASMSPSNSVSANSETGTSAAFRDTESATIYCDHNDDRTSCGDNTCQCRDGTECDKIINECKGLLVLPSAAPIYKWQSFISIIVLFTVILS